MLDGQTLLSSQSDNNEKFSSQLLNNNTQSSLLVNNMNSASKSTLKYQYSFTDAIILDELSSVGEFKVIKTTFKSSIAIRKTN